MKDTVSTMYYDIHKKELESKYMGKIIALDAIDKDIDDVKIAGIGDSVIDAYNMAIKNSDSKLFSFMRVGSKYISRI